MLQTNNFSSVSSLFDNHSCRQDKYFVAMHDLTLEGTTDVLEHPEFADRYDTFVIEGKAIGGYYAINFTLAEIKTLRLRQRFAGRSTAYNWLFAPPTLQDISQWQISHFESTGRLTGIYPELKHPDWYNEMGYPMEDIFLSQLKDCGYHVDVNDMDTPRNLSYVVPVAIQCFKVPSLKYLATQTRIPLVQLVGTSDAQPTPDLVWNQTVLNDIMTYAQAVGPDKKIFSTDWGVNVSTAMTMAKWAKDRGLYNVPWSYQQESQYIPLQFENDARRELQFYYGCLGVTAVFHEFPDRAREVADECGGINRDRCLDMCRIPPV